MLALGVFSPLSDLLVTGSPAGFMGQQEAVRWLGRQPSPARTTALGRSLWQAQSPLQAKVTELEKTKLHYTPSCCRAEKLVPPQLPLFYCHPERQRLLRELRSNRRCRLRHAQ